MKIFVAWSATRSRLVSEALAAFLRKMSEEFEVWVSHKDIVSGADWRKDLALALSSANMGIICLTRTTINNPWLAYEAGALSSKQRRRICPYLLDTDMGLAASPMSHFQTRRAIETDTWELVKDINRKTASPIQEAALLVNFKDHWPAIEEVLRDTPRDRVPKRFNRLDTGGLECLLAIHFRASVDRLLHAIDYGINDPNHIEIEHIIARATTAVVEGRRLLDPFFADSFGHISDLLEQRLPLERLAELLRNAEPVLSSVHDPKHRHQVVFDFIRREQEYLMAYITKAIRGELEGGTPAEA